MCVCYETSVQCCLLFLASAANRNGSWGGKHRGTESKRGGLAWLRKETVAGGRLYFFALTLGMTPESLALLEAAPPGPPRVLQGDAASVMLRFLSPRQTLVRAFPGSLALTCIDRLDLYT